MQDQSSTESSSESKVCYHCRLPKPFQSFSKNTKNNDGLDRLCRQCRKEKSEPHQNKFAEEMKRKRALARASRPPRESTAMDLTGQQYGAFTVVERAGYYEFTWHGKKNKDVMWLCRCICGEERTIRANTLRTGKQRSCGCLKYSPDLTGQRFGKLTAMRRTKPRSGNWICKCDCGRKRTVIANHLLDGVTVRCARCKIVDLAGQRFGRLLVIERAETPPNRTHTAAYWRCICDCGNSHITRTDYLRTGRCTSCGCWLHSLRLKDQGAVWNQLLLKFKWQAKSRGLEWALTKEQAITLAKSDCHYCGAPPQQPKKTMQDSVSYTGIDRLDSDLGYIPANVVSCCRVCNFAKNVMTVEEFRTWISRVYKHFVLGKKPSVTSIETAQLTLGAGA